MGAILAAVGFDLVEACNGQEALERANNDPPDLVLTDLVTPVMDGFELIRQLRQHPQLAEIPIVATSASTFSNGNDDRSNPGCDDFLSKPLQPEELLVKLQSCLHLKRTYSEREFPLLPAAESSTNDVPTPTRRQGSPATEGSQEIVVPSPDILESLYHLAKRGSLKRLVEHGRELIQADPSLEAFMQKIEDLARTYQDKAILEFLDRYQS